MTLSHAVKGALPSFKNHHARTTEDSQHAYIERAEEVNLHKVQVCGKIVFEKAWPYSLQDTEVATVDCLSPGHRILKTEKYQSPCLQDEILEILTTSAAIDVTPSIPITAARILLRSYIAYTRTVENTEVAQTNVVGSSLGELTCTRNERKDVADRVQPERFHAPRQIGGKPCSQGSVLTGAVTHTLRTSQSRRRR